MGEWQIIMLLPQILSTEFFLPLVIPDQALRLHSARQEWNVQANDKTGNIGKAEFVITVRDTTPPETALGNVTVGWLGSISYGDATPSVDTNFNLDGTDLVGISYYECRINNGAWQTGKVISD